MDAQTSAPQQTSTPQPTAVSQANAQPPLPPTQSASTSQTPTQPVGAQSSPAMQIQQLLLQQQQLQQQYNQIVTFLKTNPTQTPEKTQEIKAQLDQLNVAYLQGQEQLKALGYNTIQVNKPVAVKEGAKNNFSFKKFAI
ncbi:MAG: hypothetical protein LBD75_07860 [Candidatus Peribacteria bacterium]|jgi:hypothetical protein|nr:hypothetical protein [Candidatus Peribacteria bacterium]